MVKAKQEVCEGRVQTWKGRIERAGLHIPQLHIPSWSCVVGRDPFTFSKTYYVHFYFLVKEC